MVGRPREFDPDTVLEAAMRAFWAKGYEGTSLSDLVEATGLHKGSLYQAFGDKHALFVQSLRRYLEEIRQHKNEILKTADSPLDGVRRVLHGFIDLAESRDGCPAGCMAVKSMVELVPHDADVHAVMQRHEDEMQSSLMTQLQAAQASGELSADASPEVVCQMLMVFMQGLAVSASNGVDPQQGHVLLDKYLDAVFA